MKSLKYILAASVVAMTLTGCDDDDSYGKLDGLEMVNRTVSIADGATVRATSLNEIILTYNNIAAVNPSLSATLNGEAVTATANGMEVILDVTLKPYTDYTLEVPAGLVYRADDANVTAPALTVTFNTNTGLDKSKLRSSLHNPNATKEAKNLYAYLLDNYGEKQLSGAMGQVAWSTEYYDLVAKNAGHDPAIIGFDYIHLASSPSNWIDYGDISPVKNAWDNNNIISLMWHWNVPAGGGSTTVSTAEVVMPGDWSGFLQLTDEASLAIWATASVGDIVKVSTKDVAAGAQGSCKGSDWAGIADGYEYFDISGDYQMPITAEILDKLQNGGLILSGHDYTVTGVTLEKAGGELNARNDFDAEAALTPGTWQHDVFEADLAKVAGYLKLLQDANIPVLWRPFHEAAGDYTWGAWFWWGYKGVDVTKRLWVYMHDKFTNEYGLNNLIWVWTVQISDAGALASVDTAKAAYPGDNYVDIVGTDLYEDTPLLVCTDKFELVNQVVDSKLMVALTECGNLLDPDGSYQEGSLWSYFMRWYDMDENGNVGFNGPDDTVENWQTVLNSPYVINRDGVPSLK